MSTQKNSPLPTRQKRPFFRFSELKQEMPGKYQKALGTAIKHNLLAKEKLYTMLDEAGFVWDVSSNTWEPKKVMDTVFTEIEIWRLKALVYAEEEFVARSFGSDSAEFLQCYRIIQAKLSNLISLVDEG